MSHKHGAYLGGIRSIKCLKGRCRIDGDCWIWSGGLARGMPAVNLLINGKRTSVTGRRASLLLSGVELGPGQVAYQSESCPNAMCCNPAHTKVGSQAEACKAAEARDGWKRAAFRARKALEFGRINAKITAEQAQEIRESTGARKEIAARYGLCVSQITNIRNGTCWRASGRPEVANNSVFNFRPAA